jgi:hypothetical protein
VKDCHHSKQLFLFENMKTKEIGPANCSFKYIINTVNLLVLFLPVVVWRGFAGWDLIPTHRKIS